MPSSFVPGTSYSTEFKLTVACLLIPYFVSFSRFADSIGNSLSGDSFVGCWSYLPNCQDFNFLQALPLGYSQTIFYAGIFLVFLLAIEGLLKNRWKQVWWALLGLFVWKLYTMFIIGSHPGNYDYYDIVLSVVVLFFPFKAWFLRLTFVFLYFLAATIKIHEGWILGTYFTSLQTGLAIFGNEIAPLVTGIVIVGQIVGAWFLLSSDPVKRNIAFLFFFVFHLYSIVYVGWRYPSSDLFMLCTLFYLYQNPAPVGVTKKTVVAYGFLLLLLIFQFIPKLIPGDQKFTLEGNNFGLYMFEANHQCISTVLATDTKTGELSTSTTMSINAQHRCNPLFYMQRIHKTCKDNPQNTYSWTFDHSINGGPFYRMIAEVDACGLRYTTLTKNSWIKYKTSELEIIGYPLKNYY